MNEEIQAYNQNLLATHKEICELLVKEISHGLPKATSKVWHGHPVWFLDGNPIVGYAPRKDGSINLLFWSGQSFDEPGLKAEGGFKAAEARYADVSQINTGDLARWLKKSQTIQWDYKNIVKHRGVLKRLAA